MKPLSLFALATLCTLGSEASVLAQQPQHHRLLPHRQLPQSRKAIPQKEFVEAIIRDINYAEGLLTVETATEVMQVRLTPKEARNFQVGEKIQVQMLSADTSVT